MQASYLIFILVYYKKNCYVKRMSLIAILKDEGWRLKDEGGLEVKGRGVNILFNPIPCSLIPPPSCILLPTSFKKH